MLNCITFSMALEDPINESSTTPRSWVSKETINNLTVKVLLRSFQSFFSHFEFCILAYRISSSMKSVDYLNRLVNHDFLNEMFDFFCSR